MLYNPTTTMNHFHVAFYCDHRWSPKISQIIVVILQPFVSVLTSNFGEFMLYSSASQVALVVKNPPANAGNIRDVGSIPGLGTSPGGRRGNPLQYSCLENSCLLPRTEEPGRLQFMGLQRVGHNWSNLVRTRAVLLEFRNYSKILKLMALELTFF